MEGLLLGEGVPAGTKTPKDAFGCPFIPPKNSRVRVADKRYFVDMIVWDFDDNLIKIYLEEI
jgi:hypothetical protein